MDVYEHTYIYTCIHTHTHIKDPNTVKDWGQEEKGTIEDEMAGWHHRPDGHGFG